MASTRSSRLIDVAGALAHPHRLAVLEQVDQLTDEDLEVRGGVVADGGDERLVPADVAGVVGAEHDHDLVEAALALVEVVGAVGGEVGRLAVALDQHAVLVVAEVRRPQPDRAVGLVDVPLLAQPGDRLLQGAGLVQRPLGEVDVEDDAELREGAA